MTVLYKRSCYTSRVGFCFDLASRCLLLLCCCCAFLFDGTSFLQNTSEARRIFGLWKRAQHYTQIKTQTEVSVWICPLSYRCGCSQISFHQDKFGASLLPWKDMSMTSPNISKPIVEIHAMLDSRLFPVSIYILLYFMISLSLFLTLTQ